VLNIYFDVGGSHRFTATLSHFTPVMVGTKTPTTVGIETLTIVGTEPPATVSIETLMSVVESSHRGLVPYDYIHRYW
jgi:hypothetical protein